MLRSRHQPNRLFRAILLAFICSTPFDVVAQEGIGTRTDPAISATPAPSSEDLSPASTKVDVQPAARDEDIRTRLQRVLQATGWFDDIDIRVDEGVVFLNGWTNTAALKKWAGDLARNTQGVVVVANRMQVRDPPVWDFSPAWTGLFVLWRDIVRSLPLVILGLLILGLSVGAGVLTTRAARPFLLRRVRARLLRNVIARTAGVFVFLSGVYIILRVAGLTQLALTVVGGTGLLGLAVGIAFRDITENFLASIFLSMQRPFETDDLIEVAGVTGYVQQLNMRTTILMTLNGNVVQIPNATVYQSNLRNFTTNSNRREDFVVGIGYDDAIDDAQEIAREVLANHPAVLRDPEPAVLADSLGQSTVNLRVYFWINGREHSWLKVRSSVIRLVKRAFQQHGISMPDEAREVIFPHGVPVTTLEHTLQEARPGLVDERRPAESTTGTDAASTKAEAGLSSDAAVIEQQARHVEPLKHAENLLRNSAALGDDTNSKPKK